ncbi:hypothetical protein HY382_00445 [Candidatus Curtissbacteria bacterium]|nr:hypothetical protein [Candidatus Curtissbacteria bacterium]
MFKVYAAKINISDNFSPAGIPGLENFGGLASTIVLILTSVTAAAAFIFFIIAGIKFITSGGDQKKLASAQATVTYALIGAAVAILAFVILKVVQFLIGSDVPVN